MVRGGPDPTVVTLVISLHVHSYLFRSAIHGPIQVLQMVGSYDRWNTLICQRHVRPPVELGVTWHVNLVIYSGLVRVRNKLIWSVEESLFAEMSANTILYCLEQIFVYIRVANSYSPSF